MRAVQYNRYGGRDVLEIIPNAPKPSLAHGQVLVEVFAASINPIDWKIREGFLQDAASLTFPITIGGNFSGVVTKVGEGVSALTVGDLVYGQALVLNGGSGSFAQFTATNEANTALKPKNLSHSEAASLPLVGVSALQAIEQHIRLKKGQKILITGGSGGIGSIAIQLAKSKGAYVAATASTQSSAFVRGLGADEVIDYKTEAIEERLHDFDAVFDTVGGETTEKSFTVLKRGLPADRHGGILVSMLGQPSVQLAKKYGVRAIGEVTQSTTKNLHRLRELVDTGIIKPQIDKVFSLDHAKEAFAYAENGHPKGKVVVTIKENAS